MKKLFLLAMAFCSLSVFAQNFFNASQAFISKVYYAPGWTNVILDRSGLTAADAAEIASVAEYNATTGTLQCHLTGGACGERWQAQFFLNTGMVFDAAKQYDISFDVTSTVAAGTALAQFGPINLDYTPTVGTYHFSKENQAGAFTGTIVFDFGYTAANNEITISNLVIVEHDPVAVVFSGCGDTFVATSGNPALGHNGNVGDRWESASSDPQYWQWNMAEAQTFNRIKIVWEGAYAKTFNIKAGMSCDDLTTIASVENQSLAGFPYTQIIELATPVTASSIQFEGLQRGTVYGYSFWEFDVYEAVTSVLSDLSFTAAAAICKVGNTVALTATPKDQYNTAMEAEVTYLVTPATAGHVTNGVYTADAAGTATITATAGDFSKTVEILNYAGENLVVANALPNSKVIAQIAEEPNGSAQDAFFAVDGNDGSIWETKEPAGSVDHTYDAWFVVDMGALYDLELATVHFEGASSKDYDIEVAATYAGDATEWTMVVDGATTPGMKNITNYHSISATGVRYVRYFSHQAATGYGHKIFEFQVFGVEHVATALDNVESEEIHKFIQNGQIFIIKNGVLYNVMGQQVK